MTMPTRDARVFRPGRQMDDGTAAAEQVVDLAMDKLDAKPMASRSHLTVLECAPRDDLGRFMDAMRAAFPTCDTAAIDL